MNRPQGLPLRLRVALALGTWAALLAAPLDAQQDRSFTEEERITAIDLVLGFDAGPVRDWATTNPTPSDLEASDFEVLYDGRPRPVVALKSDAGPWQIVVYLDAALTGSSGLRWAAATLAGRSDELTALGEVAIVVADPAPRTLLPATRDRDRVNASLSQLARFQEGRDELVELRAEAVKEWLSPAEERPDDTELDADLLAAIAAEEARIVRARHDDLLLELVSRTNGRRSASAGEPYRVVLVATGGYDLGPDEFYRPLLDEPAASPAGHLDQATANLARTLAAYGWIVLPLLPPDGDPLKEGVRIGKLRLTGPSLEVEEQRPTPTDWEDYDRTVLWLFGGRLEGRRKPKRAEAFLELGAALHDQGKLGDAEDALRQAIYHFAGDPKTAERQAVAFARLGAVLETRERSQEANAALRLARRLDPDVEVAGAGPVAALLDPLVPLETIARLTAGAVVRSDRDLAAALRGLGQRVRLTYQVVGPPDGVLHTLEARYGSRELLYPRWARVSIPESVAIARARRLLAGEPTAGELALSAEFVATSGDGERRQGEVHVSFEPPAGGSGDEGSAASDAVVRLTLGVGGPEVESTVEHRPLGSQAGGAWSYRVGFEMPEGRSWLAVVVEDLETGAWGGRLIEVELP